MLSTTLISVLLAATFWGSSRAELTLVNRGTIQKGTREACTPDNIKCERFAEAHVTGDYGVSGHFVFISAPNQEDVKVVLSVEGLEHYAKVGARFSYHVHTNGVDGTPLNCESAGGHLNPAKLSPSTPCIRNNLALCQVGDLSAKHGPLVAGTSGVQHSYVDSQLRFAPADYSMVSRSVVIHDSKLKRIACGNVVFGSKKVE